MAMTDYFLMFYSLGIMYLSTLNAFSLVEVQAYSRETIVKISGILQAVY